MPVLLDEEPRPLPRPEGQEPSWPEKVAEILRRIFVPGSRRPEPVLVPVYVPRPGVRRRA
jgi:hypothetical protein